MAGYKRISKEIKDEVLAKVRSGQSVASLSSQYGVSTNAIYHWIAASSSDNPGALEISRLKREKEDLLRLVGELTLKMARGEKNKNGF